MMNTRSAVDPLASAMEKYREHPWVRKLSRDYRERKFNLVKTANNEQMLKIISLLKERAMSDGAKVSDLEAQKNRLQSATSDFHAHLDFMTKTEEDSQQTIQRLSAELQQCRENAREYRELKKTLKAEKKARLSLDENYKSLVATNGLDHKMLKTISEKYERACSPVRYTAVKLSNGMNDDGEVGRISREIEDDIMFGCERKYENLDESVFDDMTEFSKWLCLDEPEDTNKRCESGKHL